MGEGDNDPSSRRYAAKRFATAVQKLRAEGWSHQRALDHVMRADSEGWRAFKSAPTESAVHVPGPINNPGPVA